MQEIITRVYPVVLVVSDNKVLLGKKLQGMGKGLWTGFGGHIEDENIIECALRELKEESGLVANSFNVVGVSHNTTYNSNIKKVLYYFLVKDFSGNLCDCEEIIPCWHGLNNIPYRNQNGQLTVWANDEILFPLLLAGNKIYAEFHLDEKNKRIHYGYAFCDKIDLDPSLFRE